MLEETPTTAMRILMLDNEFPPLGGGTGVVNYHLLDELRHRVPPIHVDLITSSRSRRRFEYEEMTPAIRLHKVPVDNRNIHHSTNVELLRYTWRGYRYARRLAARAPYDLCFAFAGVPAGGIAWALRRTLGLPYIVSLQGPDVPGFENRYRYVYAALTPFIRQIWREAAAVIAISQRHRTLAWQTAPGLPIDIIVNGVDLAQFTPVSQAPRPAGTPVTVLCAARLIERKGQQHLLGALARLASQGVSLRVILAGTGDAEPLLRQQAQTLGLQDKVQFLGFVERSAMPAVYAQADIFCLPSFNEGMSMALLEAMASGLPVIVTTTGGLEELLDGNGLVAPWADVEALAGALATLAQDDPLRAEYGRRGRQIAERFAWPAIVQQYVQLCQRVLDRQPGRSRHDAH
ncbi:glycosyltransferase [Candidatus Amarolinea dominans]|uniref:glycosyltransferase n=1 Tax=Candidatus Amarolinea dominans TaxID=3140696 RepID=UPI001D310CC6|nr:glycosyltransferase [Anaerolineae bacterium]